MKTKPQVTLEKVTKLLSAYNLVRMVMFEKSGLFVSKIIQDKKYEKNIVNLIDFLEENNIQDWYLYFYSLYLSTKWQFAWELSRCYSLNALEIYNSIKSKASEEIGMTNMAEEAKEYTKSQWVDTFTHIEDIKARLLKKGQELLCKANKDKHLGFHPKSASCTNCPVRYACAQELISDFRYMTNTELDIVQIRDGWVSREDANRTLKAAGNNLEI